MSGSAHLLVGWLRCSLPPGLQDPSASRSSLRSKTFFHATDGRVPTAPPAKTVILCPPINRLHSHHRPFALPSWTLAASPNLAPCLKPSALTASSPHSEKRVLGRKTRMRKATWWRYPKLLVLCIGDSAAGPD